MERCSRVISTPAPHTRHHPHLDKQQANDMGQNHAHCLSDLNRQNGREQPGSLLLSLLAACQSKVEEWGQSGFGWITDPRLKLLHLLWRLDNEKMADEFAHARIKGIYISP
jgi:hypothetical protein